MSVTNRFDDRVAIVTGGGSGIGEACALLLAAGGAKVAVADYHEQNGERVARQIRSLRGDAIFLKTDVSRPEECEAMVAGTVEAFGRLDIAVNNAGIAGPQAPTGEYPVDDWQRVIATNLNSVFYCMRAQIPRMLASRDAAERGGGADGSVGAIVNMSSILGSVGFANAPAYTAAKHGVVGLTKAAALEYGARGVRINAVGPAFIATPMLSALEESLMAQVRALHPVGRLGTTQEVAHLAAFLCSAEASFLTGAYYLVDGGYTAR